MKYKDKESLFKAFLLKWEKQFKKIPSILHYLSTYPEIVNKLDDFRLLKINELNDSQLEWISLIAQQESPIESDFFKEYWVPIQSNRYAYYIDISSNSFPLFDVKYFFLEPSRWYKKYIIKDMSQFFKHIDSPWLNFDEYLEDVEEESWSHIVEFFNERDKLGFDGKLILDPIKKECIIAEGQEAEYILNDRGITFSGVNSLIVGLLPYETEITLEEFKAPFNRNKYVCESVKNIRALVYLLQSVGKLSIDFYSFVFGVNNQCKCTFIKNELRIYHADKVLFEDLLNKFKEIKN